MKHIREVKVTFGKYKGLLWGQVFNDDPNYIEWTINNVEFLSEEVIEELTEELNNVGYNWNRNT